jgi:hypothetical protein
MPATAPGGLIDCACAFTAAAGVASSAVASSKATLTRAFILQPPVEVKLLLWKPKGPA